MAGKAKRVRKTAMQKLAWDLSQKLVQSALHKRKWSKEESRHWQSSFNALRRLAQAQ
jgi:hypothetical protein